MGIEVKKNIDGQDEVQFAMKFITRVAPVSPDFAQWECRVHVLADLGMGEEVLAEVNMRTFNGGIAPMEKMLPEVFKAAKVRIQQASAMLRQMQERAAAEQGKKIVVTKEMPQ